MELTAALADREGSGEAATMMSDIVLESIRAFVLAGLLVFLIAEGRRRADLSRHGWLLILGGFHLLLFASILDITDNFESLNRFVVVGDTEVQATLEKLVGFLGGFIVLAFGLMRWIPTVAGVEHVERISRELEVANTHLSRANAQLARLSRQLRKENEQLTIEAQTDDLTGLMNRATWERNVLLRVSDPSRNPDPFAIIMLDVDHFKLLNDVCGHRVGDQCLIEIAQAVQECCRSTDFVARYGGEEFVVMAAGSTTDDAAALAERICKNVRDRRCPHPGIGPDAIVTISAGVAAGICGDDWQDIHQLADQALYRAKKAGRNQVQIADTPTRHLAA